MIAAQSDLNLELWDGLAIEEVTKAAFEVLGENGIIRAADKHACSECTHVYKRTPDILTGNDPAAVAGNDENRVVPPLVGEDAALAANAVCARQTAQNHQAAMDENNEMEVDHAPVKMVILDGLVTGPIVCVLFFWITIISQSEFLSIVHLTTVPVMWPMLVVEFSVHFMIMNIEQSVVFGNATLRKFKELRLVRGISSSGLTIHHNIADILWQVCKEFCDNLVNSCHGSQLLTEILSHMMELQKMKRTYNRFPILHHLGSIVLKQSVHHVEW
jgi:hypothetical protein